MSLSYEIYHINGFCTGQEQEENMEKQNTAYMPSESLTTWVYFLYCFVCASS